MPPNLRRRSLKRIEIPASFVDFAERRTKQDCRDFVNFDKTLKRALAEAYILGFIDAVKTADLAAQEG